MVLNKKYKMFATGYIKTCNGPALVQSRYSMLWKSFKKCWKGWDSNPQNACTFDNF